MERRGRDEVDVIARETSNETGKTEEEVPLLELDMQLARRRKCRAAAVCTPDFVPAPSIGTKQLDATAAKVPRRASRELRGTPRREGDAAAFAFRRGTPLW